jgi:hypothetical protein
VILVFDDGCSEGCSGVEIFPKNASGIIDATKCDLGESIKNTVIQGEPNPRFGAYSMGFIRLKAPLKSVVLANCTRSIPQVI